MPPGAGARARAAAPALLAYRPFLAEIYPPTLANHYLSFPA